MLKKRGRPSIIKTFDTETFIREIERHPALYDVTCVGYGNREMKNNSWAEIGRMIYKDWDTTMEVNRERRVNDLIKKWKAIRDSFVRDYKQNVIMQCKKRRYMYYENLQFLLPHLKANNMNFTSISQINEDVDPADYNDTEDGCSYPMEHNDAETSEEIHPAITIDGSEIFDEQPRFNRNPVDTNRISTDTSRSLGDTNRPAVDANRTPADTNRSPVNRIHADTYVDHSEPDVYGHKAFLMSFVPILNRLPIGDALQARLNISHIISTIHSQSMKHCNGANGSAADTPEDVKFDVVEDARW